MLLKVVLYYTLYCLMEKSRLVLGKPLGCMWDLSTESFCRIFRHRITTNSLPLILLWKNLLQKLVVGAAPGGKLTNGFSIHFLAI